MAILRRLAIEHEAQWAYFCTVEFSTTSDRPLRCIRAAMPTARAAPRVHSAMSGAKQDGCCGPSTRAVEK